MVRVSPEAYNTVVDTYKNPVVGLMEVGLVGAVLFHALNGVRIILVDFWAKGPRYQRQLTYGVVGAVRRALRAVRDPAPAARVRRLTAMATAPPLDRPAALQGRPRAAATSS